MMNDALKLAMPEHVEQLAITRYRPVPNGMFGYKVVAGDGTRSVFEGTKSECTLIARKLTEAFLDGAHVAGDAREAAGYVRQTPLYAAAPAPVELQEPDIRKLLLACKAPDAAFYTKWKDGIDIDVPAHWVEKFCAEYGAAREAAGYAAGLAAVRWRDVADELPKEAQEVLFVRGGKTVHGAWIGGIFWHSNQKMAAAKWMPLPAPQTDAALRGEVKL